MYIYVYCIYTAYVCTYNESAAGCAAAGCAAAGCAAAGCAAAGGAAAGCAAAGGAAAGCAAAGGAAAGCAAAGGAAAGGAAAGCATAGCATAGGAAAGCATAGGAAAGGAAAVCAVQLNSVHCHSHTPFKLCVPYHFIQMQQFLQVPKGCLIQLILPDETKDVRMAESTGQEEERGGVKWEEVGR